MLQTLPNLMSLARLLMAPMVVWLIVVGEFRTAFWLALAAAATDLGDGLLARGLGAGSALGRVLDPLADKVLMIGVLTALAYRDVVPVWLVVLLLTRDAGIAGTLWLTGRRDAGLLRPSLLGKANMVLQTLLTAAALAIAAFGLDLAWLLRLLVWMVAATAAASAVDYALRLGHRLGGVERAL